MKKPKKFDCIQMKWDIQQKISKEFKDFSDEEAVKIQMEKIMSNPILGHFLNNVRLYSETRRLSFQP